MTPAMRTCASPSVAASSLRSTKAGVMTPAMLLIATVNCA